MMNLVERETDRYEELINGMPEYLETSRGELYAELFMEMSGAKAGQSVLDAGCCSGKGAIALAKLGLEPTLQDITDVGVLPEAKGFQFIKAPVWDESPFGTLTRYDWIYCTDVMEHIQTEFVMLTLVRLCARARKGVFFSIDLVPDQFGIYVGSPLHVTVQPYVWWRDRLQDITKLRDRRDFLTQGIFLTNGQS
jgi:SAM-dependent methyltransferase